MSLQIRSTDPYGFVDSIYHELGISSASSYYYDVEFGARVIALALDRAYHVLYRHLKKEDTDRFQATVELTIDDTSLGSFDHPNYIDLPVGYVSMIQAFTSGKIPIYMAAPNEDTQYHDMYSTARYDKIMATRSGDRLFLHSPLAAAGEPVTLRYHRYPPIFSMVGTATIATVSTTQTHTYATTNTQIGYADDEWVGAALFNVTESKTALVTASTGVIATTAGAATFTNGASKSEALINVPPLPNEVIDSLISQTCLIIKGEDLNMWSGRVGMVNKGNLRQPRVIALPRNTSPFNVR